MHTRAPQLLTAGLLVVAATSAQAASLTFTIEAPGVTTSSLTQSGSSYTALVEDWNARSSSALSNSAVLSTNAGVYTQSATGSGSTIPGANVFGGATNLTTTPTEQFLSNTQAGGTLTWTGTNLPSGPYVGYFGFWWSAGDGNNDLTVTMENGEQVAFTTQTILNSPALQGTPTGMTGAVNGHYGNPTGNGLPNTNADEVYAFVNIYANNANNRIASITFSEPNSGSGFESDNHTVVVAYIDSGDHTGTDIPLPGTALLFGPGLALLGWARARRSKARA